MQAIQFNFRTATHGYRVKRTTELDNYFLVAGREEYVVTLNEEATVGSGSRQQVLHSIREKAVVPCNRGSGWN